jgi:hypothetical protein
VSDLWVFYTSIVTRRTTSWMEDQTIVDDGERVRIGKNEVLFQGSK